MRANVFRPRHLIWVLAIFAAACGFTPVYAPGSDVAVALSDIELEEPKNEQSYLFVREMEDRLGRPANASRLLKYKITIRGEGVESETERRRFVGAATYQLFEKKTDSIVASGAVDTFTGYSVSDGIFVAARQDAIKRLIVILADQMTRELTIKLSKP